MVATAWGPGDARGRAGERERGDVSDVCPLVPELNLLKAFEDRAGQVYYSRPTDTPPGWTGDDTGDGKRSFHL